MDYDENSYSAKSLWIGHADNPIRYYLFLYCALALSLINNLCCFLIR